MVFGVLFAAWTTTAATAAEHWAVGEWAGKFDKLADIFVEIREVKADGTARGGVATKSPVPIDGPTIQLRVVENGVNITYAGDARNKLSGVTFSSGDSARFEGDLVDDALKLTVPAGKSSYEYIIKRKSDAVVLEMRVIASDANRPCTRYGELKQIRSERAQADPSSIP
jgi:hypothetical protein